MSAYFTDAHFCCSNRGYVSKTAMSGKHNENVNDSMIAELKDVTAVKKDDDKDDSIIPDCHRNKTYT